MHFFRLPLFLVFLAALTSAQSSSAPTKAADSGRFSIDNIDKSVDPCVNFYQYACGNWLKNTEIPSDRSQWLSFAELEERNEGILRDVLEKAAANNPGRDAVTQKVGDFYASCMDEKAVEAKGADPLKAEIAHINAATDKPALIEEIAHLHLSGAQALFAFYSNSDLHNADQVIAYIDQGGLTLPDRSFYITDDAKMVEMRKHLTDYATQLFTMSGQTPDQAKASAETVLRIETALAKASMDRTMRRDPKNRDHKMTRDQAVALAPNFYLARYFTAVGAPNFADLNVSNPEFFKDVNQVIETESLDSLKTYATWHWLNSSADALSKAWVDERFKFRQALTGQPKIQDRWKRCVDMTDEELGEALGQKYVEVAFGPESKQRMLKMVDALEKSLDQDIAGLSWMSNDTKKQAKVKLQAIRNKIAYPEVWRD